MEKEIFYMSAFTHFIRFLNLMEKTEKHPKIYKLGSGAWKKIKQKTKARVKHIAFNLIQLYAKRKLQKGFAFGPDTHIQHELEGSFII